MQSSIYSEISRIENRFKTVHSILISSPLDSNTFKTIRSNLPISEANTSLAQKRITEDMKDAKTLGIPGTPFVILCASEGECYNIKSTSDIKEVLR